MAALISADDVRERFDIDSEIANERITPHIGSASKRLRKWVGDTNYDGALELVTTPDEDDDAGNVRLAVLQNAEAHLTMHFAILGFNSPLTGKGVVGTATASEGKVVTRYLSPTETAQLAEMYLDAAAEMVDEYTTPAGPAAFVVVPAADTSCEGATRNASGNC